MTNDPYGLSASGIPPEMIAEYLGLARRQAIANAMMQQSQQPLDTPQNAGRITSRVSPVAMAAKVFQGFAAGKMQGDADTQSAALSDKQQQRIAEAMAKYEQQRIGAPAQVMPQAIPNDDEGNAYPPAIKDAIKGDPRQAISSAMLNPAIRNSPVVMADLAAQKKMEEPYNQKPGERRMVGNSVISENAPKPVEHVAGGLIYEKDPTTGQWVPKGGPGDPMAPNRPFNADGSPNVAYQEYEKGKAQAGATRVQTNVNSFTPASEEAQRDFMKSTRTTYDALKQAPVALDNIEKAKALVPQAKGFMGPGAEGLLEGAKFLNNRFGMNINTEGVKSAEELRTRIFFNVMDNLKKMDAQPSEMQQKMMADALGKLGTDPNAMPAVLDAFADAIRGKVELHNKEVAGGVQRGVKFPYDPTITLAPKVRVVDW